MMNKNLLKNLNRSSSLFSKTLEENSDNLSNNISGKRFLVVGGAGTIGKAVINEIIKRNPDSIHIVDISENNLVELVRYIRSTHNFKGEFLTYAIDVGGKEFEALIKITPKFDYILNLSALKHVRSEKDPFTLNRLIEVNIFNAIKLSRIASDQNSIKYFCVSTDKAANPANIMGASKRLMELFLQRESTNINISYARFANVFFSDGSLTYGFKKRFENKQPISAPSNIFRYFISSSEAGELCLLSTILGKNLEIFFPMLTDDLHLTNFKNIAIKFLNENGFDYFECETEQEARRRTSDLIIKKKWPCYFFESDTTGEKKIEEFFTPAEKVIYNKYDGVGIIQTDSKLNSDLLIDFERKYSKWRENNLWDLNSLINIFKEALPELEHVEKKMNLDQKM